MLTLTGEIVGRCKKQFEKENPADLYSGEKGNFLESEKVSLAVVTEIVRKLINVKAVDMDESCLDNFGLP